ncbi:MAG TPA: hypothetical protein VIM02_14385 [Rhizomicrobium sp.]
MNIREVYDRAEQLIGDGRYEKNVALAGAITLELLNLLRPGLDAEQTAAADFAKGFWSGHGSESDRVALIKSIGKRNDEYTEKFGPRSPKASLNRLVFASLTNTTGLEPLLGEFLIGLAEDAGLSPDEIAAAFFRHLPST